MEEEKRDDLPGKPIKPSVAQRTLNPSIPKDDELDKSLAKIAAASKATVLITMEDFGVQINDAYGLLNGASREPFQKLCTLCHQVAESKNIFKKGFKKSRDELLKTLKFGKNKLLMYSKIGGSPYLFEPGIVEAMPGTEYSIWYNLAFIPNDKVQELVAAGKIYPEMSRAEASILKKPFDPPKAKKSAGTKAWVTLKVPGDVTPKAMSDLNAKLQHFVASLQSIAKVVVTNSGQEVRFRKYILDQVRTARFHILQSKQSNPDVHRKAVEATKFSDNIRLDELAAMFKPYDVSVAHILEEAKLKVPMHQLGEKVRSELYAKFDAELSGARDTLEEFLQ